MSSALHNTSAGSAPASFACFSIERRAFSGSAISSSIFSRCPSFSYNDGIRLILRKCFLYGLDFS